MLKKEQKSFDQIIRESIRETLNVNGVQTVDKSLNKIKEESNLTKTIKVSNKISSAVKSLKEALVMMPKGTSISTKNYSLDMANPSGSTRSNSSPTCFRQIPSRKPSNDTTFYHLTSSPRV